MTYVQQLKKLYAEKSKHSNYQVLSERLISLIGENQVITKSRYEQERLLYILDTVPVDNKSILDIGGNSGYFTFESIEEKASMVHYYEGNMDHAEFVRVAADALGCSSKIQMNSKYYDFDTKKDERYDVVFLLNVVHHLGDDYGDEALPIEAAKIQMMKQLNSFAGVTDFLVFQMGFCWKGDRDIGLFENGTKHEMIEYVTGFTDELWNIERIGVPVKENGEISYANMSSQNIERDNSLGEFLNRPLFIMRAK